MAELKAKAAALSLGSHQDALDFVAHSVEDQFCRPIAENFNAIDRYRKGEFAAYLEIIAGRHGHQCHLAFSRVPPDSSTCWTSNVALGPTMVDFGVEGGRGVIDGERYESAVFLGITELVQGPEGIIPSFVWVESSKDREDFRRQMFARFSSPIDMGIELIESVGEREVGLFRRDFATSHSGGVSGLVEHGAKVIYGIENDAWQHDRQWLGELDFVKILSGLRLFINEVGPWVTVDKLRLNSIEVGDVMLCANERQTWAMEQVRHGKIRSDERP
jgi:hypothetical protein